MISLLRFTIAVKRPILTITSTTIISTLFLAMPGSGMASQMLTRNTSFEDFFNTSTQHQIIALGSRPGAKAFKDVNRQLHQQNYPALIQQAKKQIAKRPRSGLAHEVLGTALFMTDRRKEAIKALEQATRLEQHQSGPYHKLGIIYMENGNLHKAQAYLEKAIKYKKDNRFAHQRLGMLFEYKKKYSKAIEHLRKGLPENDLSYLGVAVNLGRILNKLKRFDETIKILLPRMTTKTAVPEAHMILATAYFKTAQYKAARISFEQALKLEPGSDSARLGIGMSLRKSGNPHDARRLLEKLVEDRTNWLPAILELGETLLILDEVEGAKKLLDKGTRLGGSAVAIQKRIAAYHLKKKEFEKAETIYSELISTGKAGSDVYALLSELHQAKGNNKKGVSLLRKGIHKYPENWDLRFRLGSYLASLKLYDQAIPELKHALKNSPDTPPVLLRALILAQAKSGDTAGSLKSAARLYKLKPGNHEAILYAARLEANGQLKHAEKVYRKALASRPGNVLILNNLASLLSKGNRLAEAEKLARKANDITEQKNGILLDTLGWILYKQNRFKEAKSLLKKASAVVPKGSVIHYHYGMALIKTGDKNAAQKALQLVVELDSNTKWAKRAYAQLKQLR